LPWLRSNKHGVQISPHPLPLHVLFTAAQGKKVVDIVGGNMDRGNIRPVSHSTLSHIYSASKGVGALMLSMLVDQGLVDVDAPVSKCVCVRVWRPHAH
jgi:hypothetical protein